MTYLKPLFLCLLLDKVLKTLINPSHFISIKQLDFWKRKILG